MQALVLAGGEGTRLRPLTSTMPKPVVPLVDRPFIVFMLEWLARHGVEEVILSCGFMADGVRELLGDGDRHGVSLRYLVEPHPLGTGGALKFAEELLAQRFFMLNGDVLTDIDLTAQLAQHERTGARATLALVAVEDPAAYGMVRLNEDQSVKEFVEKPGPEEIDTNLVNAGAYVLEREVLDLIAPAGTTVSIERELFPALVGHGLFGYTAEAYWLDVGTPERYLQGTFDILEGNVMTRLAQGPAAAGGTPAEGVEVEGRIVLPAVVGPGSRIAAHAIVGGRAVLGPNVTVGEGAHVESSVVLEGASIGARTTVRMAIIGPGVTIGDHCHIEGEVVIGAGAQIGPRNVLAAGARIFPGVELPEAAIRF